MQKKIRIPGDVHCWIEYKMHQVYICLLVYNWRSWLLIASPRCRAKRMIDAAKMRLATNAVPTSVCAVQTTCSSLWRRHSSSTRQTNANSPGNTRAQLQHHAHQLQKSCQHTSAATASGTPTPAILARHEHSSSTRHTNASSPGNTRAQL